jgi:hypothetical protein
MGSPKKRDCGDGKKSLSWSILSVFLHLFRKKTTGFDGPATTEGLTGGWPGAYVSTTWYESDFVPETNDYKIIDLRQQKENIIHIIRRIPFHHEVVVLPYSSLLLVTVNNIITKFALLFVVAG